MAVPVYVLTSEKYLWQIRPFAYLFNIYWSSLQSVTVVTDVKPTYPLPPNFSIRSVSGNSPLPKEKWSDGLAVMLNNIPHDHFVLLLEDYWLIRTVDHKGIETLADYMRQHDDILRLDLTDDRQYNGEAYDIGSYGHYDLVETPPKSAYQMSLQAGIWNKGLLMSVLRSGLTPWEVELYLSPALHDRPDLRVVGTRQCPVRYANISKTKEDGQVLDFSKLQTDHLDAMRRRGWLPILSEQP